MSDDRQQTSDDWDAMRQVKTLGALTREQLILAVYNICDTAIKGDYQQEIQRVLDHDASLRATITQQAQELERVRLDNAQLRHDVSQVPALQREITTWKEKSDAIVGTAQELWQQLAASQARCREMEKECAGLAAGSCEAPYGDDYGNKRCKTIDHLQATLAAREARITELERNTQ